MNENEILLNSEITRLRLDLEHARHERDRACSALWRVWQLSSSIYVFSRDVKEVILEVVRP